MFGLVRRSALFAVFVLAGCAGSIPSPPPPTMVVVQTAHLDEARMPNDAAEVSVRMPDAARYTASILRAERPPIRVRVVNRGDTPLDVSSLRVHLTVEREGTAYRCADDAGPPRGAREPRRLLPRDDHEFERVVDCVLPLAGVYTVRVAVAFGDDAWKRPREVQTSRLAVRSTAALAPRPIGDTPLRAVISASPMIASAQAKGSGRILIAVVNTGASAMPVPALRVRALVRRSGPGPACEGESIPVRVPAFLDAGASHREPIELSCIALGAPGTYAIEVRLVVDGEEELELGTVRVDVTNDPSLVTPRAVP